MSRDSFVPDHEPGGGGWSIQQITLSTLYLENTEHLLNWWTQSNKGLNLLKYQGCKLTIFRQPYTDIIFHYMNDMPKVVSKYFYAGLHPIKLMNHNRKVTIPSFNTQPHKKKPFKKIFIPPPKLWKNQWYFQQQICDYPLIQFTSSACSLTELFGSKNAQNNNVTLYCLNVTIFASPWFQYRKKENPYPIGKGDNYFLYSLQKQELPLTGKKYSQLTFLGQTMLNEPGFPLNSHGDYKDKTSYWGNPFYYQYLHKEEHVFKSKLTVQQFQSKMSQTITDSDFILSDTDFIVNIRYNPWKDKGKGNKAYWVSNIQATKGDWEPMGDPDLEINDYPFWIMLYGWEDMTRRIGKATNLDNDWILVLRSNYFNTKETAYVPLNLSFINGQGPYDVDRSEIKGQDIAHWYPRYRYQREAVNSIIESGPAIAHNTYTKNIQGFVKYKFLFKWGGCPASMENIYDPKTQPVTPTPYNFNLLNEITDPTTSIQNYIYPWDQRRDQLTQAATDRITTCPINDTYVFTDGTNPAETIQLFQAQTEDPEETQKTQEKTLLQQLDNLQLLNQQLQLKFLQLKSQMQSM